MSDFMDNPFPMDEEMPQKKDPIPSLELSLPIPDGIQLLNDITPQYPTPPNIQ